MADANEYQVVCAQGKSTGEATGDEQRPCTEGQYAAGHPTTAEPAK